jgi:hypothetical protein
MIHHTLSGPLLKEAGMISDEDVRLINSLKNPPPVPVSEKDVFVRRCRLAGNAVDAYYGRFRTADLKKLLSLVQGAPMLVGHDKRSLGIARFFNGTIEQHEGVDYIVPKFYWLRGHSSSDDLRVAIDGGLYNEASISFAYETPTCSICGDDIRNCEHLPGAPTEKEGEKVFYYYDNVVAVMEGSLVYRGAQPGTGFCLSDKDNPAFNRFTISDPNSLGSIPVLQSILRIKRHGKWYRAPLVEETA